MKNEPQTAFYGMFVAAMYFLVIILFRAGKENIACIIHGILVNGLAKVCLNMRRDYGKMVFGGAYFWRRFFMCVSDFGYIGSFP